MRLLVVDDDPKFRSYISNGLRESGCECATAADGDAAMKMLEAPGAAPFDLILLDVMMPVQNGWDLLHDLRERGRETPVIFVTARDAVEERVKGLKLGADDYIIKPFAFDELLAHHDQVLTRAQLLHEVWGIDFDPETNVVDVHVARLRRKLDRHGKPLIHTVRGEGYKLSVVYEGAAKEEGVSGAAGESLA